ncbi:MAG: hypothetical protein Fur0012_11350 [Elusimicrobiota bacterium]
MKFYRLLLCFLATIAVESASQAVEKLTLEEAIELGTRSNISVLKSEQSLIIARQQVREARLIFLPSIVFSADYARSYLDYPLILNEETGPRYLDPYYEGGDFYGVRATAALPLYTGGRYRKTLELAKINYSREKTTLDIAVSQTALKIKKAFYLALKAGSISRDLDTVYPLAENLFSSIGKNSAQYFEAFKIIAEMRREKAEAEKNYKNSVKDLKSLISKIGDFEPEGDFSPSCEKVCDEKKISLAAVENSGELQKNIYQSRIDAVSVEMAVRRKYPNIYLGFSYDLSARKLSSLANSDERMSSSAAFINLSLPINYDFWTQIQKKKAEERANELEMLSIREDIKNRAETSCREYNFYCQTLNENGKILQELRTMLDVPDRDSFSALKKIKIFCELKKSYYGDVYLQREKSFELEGFIKK